MMRCRCDLFWRCLRASYNIHSACVMEMIFKRSHTPAICMAVARCVLPLIFVRCIPSSSFPKSVVKVTSISGPLPAMFIRPTEDSGFAWVLAEKMRFTASAWASHLDGLKRSEKIIQETALIAGSYT